jgi:trimeric autotransporter adhesin
MRKKCTLLLTILAAAFMQLHAQTEVRVTSDIESNVTWTSDNYYVLDGFIFVEEGATLTIQEGTKIYAEEGSQANASALVIKRGGKINAVGTADEPIVFTSIQEKDNELTKDDRGFWGGLIILGKAPHNNPGNDNFIEGVPVEEQAYYGGDDPLDNSGRLKFVSIRHGGSELDPDEEINGLTLGAVGSSTSISFVEVIANDDDGVEWFGGNVNTKHLVVAYCSDDQYDMDEGFHGHGQFWVAVQDEDTDNFGEHDGGPSNNRYGQPYTRPIQSNVTYIGPGTDANERTLTLREYWGGEYHNSIFAEQGKGIRLDYVEEYTGDAKGGSFTLWNNGVLKLENNIFQNVADGTAENIFTVYSDQQNADKSPKYPVPADSSAAFAAYFSTAGNQAANAGVSIANPIPTEDVSGADFTDLDNFFKKVDYKGAFNPEVTAGHWAGNWTKVYASTSFELDPVGEVSVVSDITEDVTWTNDNEYVLDGFIFVEEGATLTIQEGTKIYAEEGSQANASALVIKRGGKINAVGTADEPIVFTSIQEKDNELTKDDRGFWGGLIILGKAPHNNPGNDNFIEGVPVEEQAYYGGDDPLDNSGRLKFVSIRHGGSELDPDEEINGLTLGAVGSSTSISFVEVIANDDDGVEWFGGNVNTKHLVVAYCSDDQYDMDEGFHGHGQFWVAVQDEDTDNFGEHDGGPSNNRYGQPYTRPIQSNVTYIGPGTDANERTLTLREYWGGEYHNSIFAEQGKGIRLDYVEEYTGDAKGGSFTLWNNGVLKLENNIFQNVADGTAENIFTVYSDQQNADKSPKYPVPADSSAAFAAYFSTAGNQAANAGVSIASPIPTEDVSGADFANLNDFFTEVDFKGAFNPAITGMWAGGWTKTYAEMTFDDKLITFTNPISFVDAGARIYPNPIVDMAQVKFDNSSNEIFEFTLYSVDGSVVRTVQNIYSDSFYFNASDLNTGIYMYELKSVTSRSTGKVLVK